MNLSGKDPPLWAVEQGGGLPRAVGADGTSGDTGFRFRFPFPQVPDAEGRPTVELHRVQPPPCVFADRVLRLLPPPGNRPNAAIEAGERGLR